LARTLGTDYTIKYGDHTPGSSDFSFVEAPRAPTA
jgi:hypothetical protein